MELYQEWAHMCAVVGQDLHLVVREGDGQEPVGLRLAVAGPGSLAGKYPPGNTGRTTMRLTETASLPADIGQVLRPYTTPD